MKIALVMDLPIDAKAFDQAMQPGGGGYNQ